MGGTFNGWPIIAMPTHPPAPQNIEVIINDIVAVSVSPFTGQQQVQDWQRQLFEVRVSMPPLTEAQIPDWVNFLMALKGQANVTQFPASFVAAYPNLQLFNSSQSPPAARYFRLKTNQRGFSLTEARVYGVTFDLREAI